MGKAPHWEVRLSEQIEAARERPFSWGEHDCATWAADVWAALTGEQSPAIAWRGRYKTALGAERFRRKAGYPSMEAAGMALLGEPLPTPLLAQRGDVVFAQDAFGVCVGARAAFVGAKGLEFLRLRDCVLAWRV